MSFIVGGTVTDSRTVSDSIRTLCRLYPFLQHTVIGKSVCGRPIEALSIGHSEQAVLLASGLRAQEHFTAALSLRLCEELCQLYQGDGCTLPFDPAVSRTVVIVPMLNPDGADIALHGSKAGGSHAELLHIHGADIKGYWQANAVGVEPALNFNAARTLLEKQERDHGISGPCGRGFGGTSPESEPETAALCALCRRMTVSHALLLTSGNGDVRWQCGDQTPPHSRMTARFLASASQLHAASPTHPLTGGGFTEWFITAFSRPAFQLCLSCARNADLDDQYDRIRKALLLSVIL